MLALICLGQEQNTRKRLIKQPKVKKILRFMGGFPCRGTRKMPAKGRDFAGFVYCRRQGSPRPRV